MNSKEVIERLKEFANHFSTNGYPYNQYSSSSAQIKSELEIIEKDLEVMEEHKQIEKDLGIDLITKDKVEQATRVFYKNKHSNEIELYGIESFERKGVNVYLGYMLAALNVKTFYLPYEDYGKTWALTKEELK